MRKQYSPMFASFIYDCFMFYVLCLWLTFYVLCYSSFDSYGCYGGYGGYGG